MLQLGLMHATLLGIFEEPKAAPRRPRGAIRLLEWVGILD